MYKKFSLLIIALFDLCLSLAGFVQPYPNKPISLIVPQVAGGMSDIGVCLIALK